jgi:hypothetical protein
VQIVCSMLILFILPLPKSCQQLASVPRPSCCNNPQLLLRSRLPCVLLQATISGIPKPRVATHAHSTDHLSSHPRLCTHPRRLRRKFISLSRESTRTIRCQLPQSPEGRKKGNTCRRTSDFLHPSRRGGNQILDIPSLGGSTSIQRF